MGHYLVVGGGITGLSAAWEFARLGHNVTVVNDSGQFGGKTRSEHRSGYLIEHGPDSVINYRPAALQLAGELGIGDQVISVTEPREVSLRVNGRMEPMPASMGLVLPTRLGPFARTRILTWPQKLRAGMDVALPRMLGPQDMSVGELLRRRLGAAVVTRFADPLLGGVYGASVDELSVDAVLPTLRTSEAQHRSLLLASLSQGRASRRGRGAGGSPFRSLRDGMGSLVTVLVAALADRGVELVTNRSVTSLRPTSGGVLAGLDDGGSIAADAVVLACGGPAAAELVADFAPAATAALARIPLGSTSSVSLGFDVGAFEEPPVGHGYLEAGPAPAPISGVTISSNKWAGRAPEGKILVRAFVPDRVGALAGGTDTEIIAAASDYVAEVLGATSAPELTHIVRWRKCMPKYVVGHRNQVAAVQGALAATPRVALAGSAINGVGVPDCVADGRRVAGDLTGL